MLLTRINIVILTKLETMLDLESMRLAMTWVDGDEVDGESLPQEWWFLRGGKWRYNNQPDGIWLRDNSQTQKKMDELKNEKS